MATCSVVAGLDGSVERLPRLLYESLDHGVDVCVLDVAPLVDLDVLDLAMHLPQDGQPNLVLRLHGGLDLVFQFVVLHLALAFVMRLL